MESRVPRGLQTTKKHTLSTQLLNSSTSKLFPLTREFGCKMNSSITSSTANDVIHAVALLNRLNDMRMRDECCDLILRGTGIRVHSSVMAALSPYIDSALTQHNDLMHTGGGDASAAILRIEQRVDVGVRVDDTPTGEGGKRC